MKIDKNIPVPPRRLEKGKWKDIFPKMKVSDSIVVKTYNDRQSLYQYMKRRDFIAISRKVDGGYRIWKTKNDH